MPRLVLGVFFLVVSCRGCPGPFFPRLPSEWPSSLSGFQGAPSTATDNVTSLALLMESRDTRWWNRGRLARDAISTSSPYSWAPILSKLRAGKPITVMAFGSSIVADFSGCYVPSQHLLTETGMTAFPTIVQGTFEKGHASCYTEGYMSLFMAAVNATWPHPEHLYVNAGIAATTLIQALNDRCVEHRLPKDRPVDLLLFEGAEEGADAEIIESLYEKVSQWMSTPPALVILRSFHIVGPQDFSKRQSESWQDYVNRVCVANGGEPCGQCSAQSQAALERRIVTAGQDDKDGVPARDAQTHALARRNGWAVVSIREMLAAGLRDKLSSRFGWSTCTWLNAFMGDVIHPNPIFGSRVIADALLLLLSDAASVPCSHGHPEPVERSSRSTTPLSAEAHSCFTPAQINATSTGWRLVAGEVVRDRMRNKPGWIGETPGASISITFLLPRASPPVLLRYLTSYEHMGQVAVTCNGGCRCEEQKVDAHSTSRTSLDRYSTVPTSGAEGDLCTLTLTILETTQSGEHKFKLTSVEV